jgi:hypothetical protein
LRRHYDDIACHRGVDDRTDAEIGRGIGPRVRCKHLDRNGRTGERHARHDRTQRDRAINHLADIIECVRNRRGRQAGQAADDGSARARDISICHAAGLDQCTAALSPGAILFAAYNRYDARSGEEVNDLQHWDRIVCADDGKSFAAEKGSCACGSVLVLRWIMMFDSRVL